MGLGQYSIRRSATASAMRKPPANRVLLIFYGLVEDALGRNEFTRYDDYFSGLARRHHMAFVTASDRSLFSQSIILVFCLLSASHWLLSCNQIVQKTSCEFFPWDRGHSHSHLRSFPLTAISVPKLESYSHSNGTHMGFPVPLEIPFPWSSHTAEATELYIV